MDKKAEIQKSISIQLVRNATLIINYAGNKILVDPMLGIREAFESFAGISRNPIVDLPLSTDEILDGVDITLISHTHIDHIDPTAISLLDKNTKLIIQPKDLDFFEKRGFTNIEMIPCSENCNNLTICRTVGQHGRGEVLTKMGDTSGFVLQSEGSPTVYIIGDSVLSLEVIMTIERYTPDIIICNSGGAIMPGYESTPILMDENEVLKLVQISGNAKIVAVHMDALDHCYTTREILRNTILIHNIEDGKVLIPKDGEVILF